MDPRAAAAAAPPLAGDHAQFAIGFDPRDRERVLAIWDELLRGSRWSEGDWNRRFEEAWSAWNGLGSVAFGSWSGAMCCSCFSCAVRSPTTRPARCTAFPASYAAPGPSAASNAGGFDSVPY